MSTTTADAHPEKADYSSVVGTSFKGCGNEQVKSVVDEYNSFFDKSKEGDNVEVRKDNYTTMVNHYYDLVTDFYEYGWGQSFHFAPRNVGEEFHASLARHEDVLADHLKVKPGQKVLDVGCGVGGPMRQICRHTGANVVGINNNDYQLQRVALLNERAGLADKCSGVKGDFMKMPFPDNHFDAAYAIEATCHAPDRSQVYAEMMRVVKPGGVVALYDWCMTDKYDPENAEHKDIKYGIEIGDGLPPLLLIPETVACAKKAGWQNITHKDLVDNSEGKIPWYATLQGSWSLAGFRMTWLGRQLTHNMCRVLEFVGIAPTGTVDASQVLMTAADALVAGGEQEIFTPMVLVTGTKPE